ncbi:LysR family transcriptional regulator [Frateuria aurantia]
MIQLEDMRLLVQTLDSGSFTAAADRAGVTKQYISRRIMSLEAQLGTQLLIRTTRHLRPTDLGRAYAERARGILQEVADLEQSITGASQSPRGHLRITAPMSFGTLHLSGLLARFLAAHPQVSVEMELNDRVVDLHGEGYDLAIRIGALADSSLIARRIAPMEIVVCCSPSYMQFRDPPKVPADLQDHDCLLYGHGSLVEWAFGPRGQERVRLQGRLRANNGELIRDAAVQGLGIAYLPTFIVDPELASGRLVTLLDAYRPARSAVYAVYPQHRQVSPLLATFCDFMTRELAVRSGEDQAGAQ